MKMLVGFNGSPASIAAFELALDHAIKFDAQLTTVISSVGGSRQTLDDVLKIRQITKTAEEIAEKRGIDTDIHELVRGMSPGEDLVQYAQEKDFDLIYVGIEKRSRTQKLLLGSNAQYVILKAHCPVITVK
jgi:nucleotide-binding universal stress UspA family protein